MPERFIIWRHQTRDQEAPHSWLNQEQSSGPSGSAVLIATGGTSGRMKFVVHTEKTLMASVRGFQAHFQVEFGTCLLRSTPVSCQRVNAGVEGAGWRGAGWPFSPMEI